jgi:hypothetical protein
MPPSGKNVPKAEKAKTARATRKRMTAAAEARGELVFRPGPRGTGAYHADGKRMTGIHRFIDRKVLVPITERSKAAKSAFRPLIAKPTFPSYVERAVGDEATKLSAYQKKLRAHGRGRYIHRQLERMVKDGAASVTQAATRAVAAAKRPVGQRGASKRKVDVHPSLRIACRLLDHNGYVPLGAEVGVFERGKPYATQIDLLCYKRGKPKDRVHVIELKTGFEDEREYTRPKYKLRGGDGRPTNVTLSEKEKQFVQAFLSSMLLKACQPTLTIEDVSVLNVYKTRSELVSVPDDILKLQPVFSQLLCTR